MGVEREPVFPNVLSQQSDKMSKESDIMSNQSKKETKENEEINKDSQEASKQGDVMNQDSKETSKQDCLNNYRPNASLLLYSSTLTNPIYYAVAHLPNLSFSREDFIFRNLKFKALIFSGKPEFIPMKDYSAWKDYKKTNDYIDVKFILNSKTYPIVIKRMSSVDDLSKAALLFIRCLKYNEVSKMELILNRSKLEDSENGLKIENNSDIHVIATEKSKPQSWSGIIHKYENDNEIRSAYVPLSLNMQELLQKELLFSVHYLAIHIPILEDESPLYVTLYKTPLPYLRELTIFTQFKKYLYSILHISLSLVRVCDDDSIVQISNPLNSNVSQELNQLTTKMKELQEKQTSTDNEIKKLVQSYSELEKKLNYSKQTLYSSTRNGPVTSLRSALGSLIVNNYYYFFYSYSANTIIIDIIQSFIKKGSCMYNRTQSIYTRQPRIPKLPEGIFPKVQRPLVSNFVKIEFEYREFMVRINEKMTGAQLYSVVKHSLLADEFINEWDSIVLIYNMNHISPKDLLMSLNMTANSVIQAKPVYVSLQDSLQQDSFIMDLQRQKYANVQHLVLLAECISNSQLEKGISKAFNTANFELTQQAAATFSTYHLMPALKSLILYRAADANAAMMKEKTLDNTLAASQNSANIETEMRSIAQQLNRLQDNGMFEL
ncbi:uncharacterized protein [Blastocystis hominis]|uniref:Uncharacterized protein n=1 Tax=Blastocystis hominis TaxID=12968 RepID=D8M5X5_BLAHO|nr:uncharacterized protein [Blastocystis hominis]CBK23574.2 unnamed protein product [Blastocystis hominis]|eukprot:XP_012897622.1 uncharacterized protein [Blastocystis hominis]